MGTRGPTADAAGSPADRFDAFAAAVDAPARRALIPVVGPAAARQATAEALARAWQHGDSDHWVPGAAGAIHVAARAGLPRRPPGGPDRFPGVAPGLAAGLAALPDEQRTAVYLRVGCGVPEADLARFLGVWESTVRNHLQRGLDRLARAGDDDDDLTAAIGAWAAATDPATDPIEPAGLRTEPRSGVVRREGNSVGVALVVLGVVLVGGWGVVTWILSNMDAGLSDDDETIDLVVDADVLPYTPEGTGHRWALLVAGEEVAAGQVLGGRFDQSRAGGPEVTLVARTRVPRDADLTFRWEQYDCSMGQRCDISAKAFIDPPDDVDPSQTCDAAVPAVTTERAVAVATLRADGCTVVLADEVPTLTTPPDWSLRTPPDDRCSTIDHGDDPQPYGGGVRGAQCLADALADGGPPVELDGPDQEDPAGEYWYRVDDGALAVVHRTAEDGGWGWTEARCTGLDVLDALPWIAPTGCAETVRMPLVLDDGTGLPAGPAAPEGTVDVVLDGSRLPPGADPATWAWAVHVGDDDTPVATGTVLGATGGLGSPVAVLADDLPVLAGDRVGVVVDDGTATADLCDGGPPPPDRPAARVLVARIEEGDCDVSWVAKPPGLSVPPAWSLRSPATACVDLAADAGWGRCLADAVGADEVAEWTDADDAVTYRVAGGVVAVVRRTAYPDAVLWQRQECVGLDVAADGRSVTPTDCGAPEEMSLDP